MRSKWFCKYKLAHRGLHNEMFPENSLGAFENACTYGFAIELDVRLLRDGTPVIFHDPNTLRMCGIDKNINDITLEELSEYKLNNTKYSIPTLKEVLEMVAGRTPIMIEIKPVSKKEKIEEKVYELIKDYKGDLAVKSFNPIYMIWFRKHAPEVLRGMLGSFFEDRGDLPNLPYIFKQIVKKLSLFNFVKPDFISYDHKNLPNKYTSKRKVPILAWTITSQEKEDNALKHADNVIFEGYLPQRPINYE